MHGKLNLNTLSFLFKYYTKRYFYYNTDLWNSLPTKLRQFVPEFSSSPLAICPSLCYKKFKPHLFHSSYPPKSVYLA